MKVVLTIAGSDCSGGAGIQADLKTILAHGAYGMSVVTALTAQNTTGVFGVLKTDAAFIGTQLDAVFRDLRPDAVKIGMIADEQAVQMISDKLRTYQAGKIVVDTVLASTSGTRLTGEEALACAKEELFPLASLLTPNLKEAETLAGIPVTDKTSMQLAADRIAGMFGCAVLIKGGHLHGAADDLLYQDGKYCWLHARRMDNPNTHGTGCTLSSAIACNLAEGMRMEDAVYSAKAYVADAIADGLALGAGRGPLNHGCRIFGSTGR